MINLPWQVDIFEMNRCSRPLVHCPLLEDMDSYTPDTIDLCKDHEARRYWIQCFVNSTDSVSMWNVET